jgi:hypothetical protein
MTTPVAPDVDCELHHPTLAVADDTQKLGFRPGFLASDRFVER